MGFLHGQIAESDNFFAGDKATLQIEVDDGASTPGPQNMGGWALSFEIKRGSLFDAEFTKTTGASEITITDGLGTNSRADVDLVNADTVDLSGLHRYRLFRTDTDEEQTLAVGDFYIHS